MENKFTLFTINYVMVNLHLELYSTGGDIDVGDVNKYNRERSNRY